MNIYEKLQKCRVDLQQMNIKKSGKNKFSGYSYFELGDFLPTINDIFFANKLCSVVTFTHETAILTIIDTDKPEDKIEFASPMASAELKGCHPVQNLGATETYARRYLYITALEIVESDVLDKNTDNSESIGRKIDDYPKKSVNDNGIEGEFTSSDKNPRLCKICGASHIKSGDVMVKVGGKWVGEKNCYLKQKKESVNG